MAGDHYIQQSYLRGFAVDQREESVAFWHEINDVVKVTGTRVLCSEKDFFTTFGSDEEKNREIDQYLTNEVEPSLPATLEKLEKRQKLTTEEKKSFSRYITFKYYMIPSWRELHGFLSSKYLSHIKDATKMNKWAEDLFATYRQNSTILTNYNWQVYVAAKGSSFITSDNPVTCVSSPSGDTSKGEVGASILAKNNRIFFPLSKKYLVKVWSDAGSGFSYENASKTRVNTYNSITQKNHYKYIIGSSEALVEKYAALSRKEPKMTELQKTAWAKNLDSKISTSQD